jgi:hypothetical protein
MVYQGHVENGTIRLQDSVVLPEGAEVRVEIMAPADHREPRNAGGPSHCSTDVGLQLTPAGLSGG